VVEKVKTMSLKNGRHLKAGRVLAGMTQSQLAEAAGLHVNSVKYHEQQETRIGGHAVTRMRDALGAAGISFGEEHISGKSLAVLRG
jgi:hypothetical protein